MAGKPPEAALALLASSKEKEPETAMTQQAHARQIAEDLARQIEGGALVPGERLPSEPELARVRGVNRQTARAALRLLEQRGLAVAMPRSRRIVRDYRRLEWRLGDPPVPGGGCVAPADAWDTEMRRQGHLPGPCELKAETVMPPRTVAVRLNLTPGRDLCAVRRWTCSLGGRPAIASDEFYDRRVWRPSALGRDMGDPLLAVGRGDLRDEDEVIIRMPGPDEALRLSIPDGTPVAEHTRVTYSGPGAVVRLAVTISPGDLFSFRYQSAAPGVTPVPRTRGLRAGLSLHHPRDPECPIHFPEASHSVD